MYIAPTVGRIVYFFDPNTRHAENDEIITQAAIIAHVHGSNSSHSNVNLAVFAADGSTFKRLNVPLIQDGWSLPSPIGPYATWTPHQIGTAKAEAALSAAALEKNREETAQQFAMPDIPEGHEFAQIGGISAISPLPLPTVKDIDDDTLAGLIKASSQDSSNRDRTFPVHFENGHIYVNKDVLEAEAYRREQASQPQKAQASMPDAEVGEPDALMSVCHADWHFLDSLYGSMLDNKKYKELQNFKSRIAVALAQSPAAEQEQAVMDDLKVAIGNAAIGNSPGNAEAFKAKHLTQMPITSGIPYDYTLWSGGPCPVPHCIVDMYLRDGSVISKAKANDFDWLHDVMSEQRQIVAYKVLGSVEQKPETKISEKLQKAVLDLLASKSTGVTGAPFATSSKFDGMPDSALTYLASVTQDLPACTTISVGSFNMNTGDVSKVADVTHAEIIAEQTRRLGARMTAFTSGSPDNRDMNTSGLCYGVNNPPSKLAAFPSETLHQFLDDLRKTGVSNPFISVDHMLISLQDLDDELTLRGDFYGAPRHAVQGTPLQPNTKSA